MLNKQQISGDLLTDITGQFDEMLILLMNADVNFTFGSHDQIIQF